MMRLTPAMEDFISYFGALGPRWGLPEATCRVHAILYLADMPMAVSDIAALLSLPPDQAAETLEELRHWGMAHETASGWDARRDPWDMMLAALQQRTGRELQPALDMIAACQAKAASDGITQPVVIGRMEALAGMFRDLAAISRQTNRLSPPALARLIRWGGRASRFAGKFG